MTTLQIEYPEDLLALEELTKDDLARIAREAFVVRLYDLGKISSGRGAELLHTTRWAFLDLLGHYNVSVFDETTDLEAEARLATAASRI